MVRDITEYQRVPWEDRFKRPSIANLRAGLPEQTVAFFDQLTTELSDIWPSEAEMAWQGICWKWTLVYDDRRGHLPLALVIPNPDDLQIALKLDRKFVREVRHRRFKRAVQDGLELADEPFDTDWAVWTISSKSMLEELISLTRLTAGHQK